MGWRLSLPNCSPEVYEIYKALQEELLETPGHARYFADEIERIIADPKNNTSVRERNTYLRETLRHLPSPETIQVLGFYLHDDRFNEMPAGDVSGITGPSCNLAALSLRNIGLRESQEFVRTEGPRWHMDEDIENLRRWWKLVESGERTFSFKGQSVEYRFLPDGTWESIPMANPPDDDPRNAVAVADSSNEGASSVVDHGDDDSSFMNFGKWFWIGFALLFSLGGMVFWMYRCMLRGV